MTEATVRCPICEAEYRVVRIEAPPSRNNQLLCLGCGGPLRNREGKLALKYFHALAARGWRALRKLKPA
jgi:hypothetical protein